MEGSGVKGIGLAGAVLVLDEAGYYFPASPVRAPAIAACLIAAIIKAGRPMTCLHNYLNKASCGASGSPLNRQRVLVTEREKVLRRLPSIRGFGRAIRAGSWAQSILLCVLKSAALIKSWHWDTR